MEFSRQDYWSGLPFPLPEDLPNPEIELGSPTLQADSKIILICIWILKSDPRPQTCVASDQTTARDGVQTHTSADNWIKALLSKALPTRARPSFSHASPSHQEAYTSLLASSIRGQTEEAPSHSS